MRHARHYVDELLGDAPLRTVREIAISEIDAPPDESLSLDRLEESIRRLGVIEPLLVGKRGAQYRVIAGMRRLRAARTVGLSTVPCLVHDVDDEKLTDMRDAAMQRLVPPPPPAAAAEPVAPTPAIEPAPRVPVQERLRSNVLNDLSSVEQLREKIVSAASDFLARPAPALELASASTGALVNDAIAAVALEARLRGVRVERADVIGQQADYGITIDGARCRTALTGLLQCLLSLAHDAGAVLEVRSQVTTIRPALIVDCRLRDAVDRLFTDEALTRFFDRDWVEHPCGPEGAIVLAAVARTARLHGGRVHAHGDGTVTFVVPRPLSDL